MIYNYYFDYKLDRYVRIECEEGMNVNRTSDVVTIKDGKIVWSI